MQYDLDVLIYATGFDFMSRENVARVTGSDGRTVADKWREQGTRTFLGLHTAGFPNLLIPGRPSIGRRQVQLHRVDRGADRLRGLAPVHDARQRPPRR